MTSQKAPPDHPDPEVAPKAKRRKFSAEYKVRILEEADRCTERGEIGVLLAMDLGVKAVQRPLSYRLDP